MTGILLFGRTDKLKVTSVSAWECNGPQLTYLVDIKLLGMTFWSVAVLTLKQTKHMKMRRLFRTLNSDIKPFCTPHYSVSI